MLRLWPRWAAVALAVIVALPTPAAAAPEDDLTAKRQEAERIQREIERNGEQISILDEEFNLARLAIDEATAAIAQAEAGLADAEARTGVLKDQLAGRAAQMYVTAGSAALAVFDSPDAAIDFAARTEYGAAAAEQDDRLIEELGAAREDLGLRRAALEQQRAEAQAQQDSLGSTRDELAAAQAHQEVLLDSVEGEIAGLVAEIEAERQREEEARARAELERKMAAEAAERAARTTTTTPTAAPPRSVTSPTTAAAAATPDKPVIPDVPAPNANAQIVVDTALAQLGKPYKTAGKGPDSFDCSGLTGFAWAAAGVTIPHSSQAQYAGLPHVSMDEIAPGDLLFYGSPIHHVGIYVGNEQYVHAPQTGDVVKISSIFRRDYAGAARPG